MFTEKQLDGCKKLIARLKQLEDAEDLDESTLDELDIDFSEIISWAKYWVENLLEEYLKSNH